MKEMLIGRRAKFRLKKWDKDTKCYVDSDEWQVRTIVYVTVVENGESLRVWAAHPGTGILQWSGPSHVALLPDDYMELGPEGRL